MTRRCTLPILSLVASLGTAMADLPAVDYEEFASGFVSPLSMIPYGEGDHAFLVIDQAGAIHFLGEDGGKPGEAFLDLRDEIVELKPGFDERGSLGLALHPDFDDNKKIYVYYSGPLTDDAPDGYDHTARLSEFKVKDDGSADKKSERVLLTVHQPQWNHDGGNLVFGKDGYLYLGLGDGGAANDLAMGHEKGGNGQALNRLLGSILRLDVDKGSPYGIPSDNPLVGRDGRDEIFAWGIRNPWGITVDPKTGDVIVADVGQNRFEEINVLGKDGGNFGWPRYEGYAPFKQKQPSEMVKLERSPAPRGMKAPVIVYSHNEAYGKSPGYGISVTGGHVYRGKAIPELDGVYLFADWAMSWAASKHGLFAGVRDDSGQWTMEIMPGAKTPSDKDQLVVGFGQDHDGEIYVLTNESRGPSGTNGKIWKIVPAK